MAVGATAPARAHAQNTGDGFLFQEPRLAFTMRGGWASASAGSDLFAFTTELLTLDRRDFSSLSFGTDYAVRVGPRTRLVFSGDISARTKRSEFRDYVDNRELPIEQTTQFTRLPVTVGVRQYLIAPGRSVGRYAWIPTRVAPFVGAGGGMMYHRFKQEGDFIDFETFDVFRSQFTSSGWAPTAYALAGVDYSLGGRFALTAQARYVWSRAELSTDFSGFEKLDLSGMATSAGLTIRF
jgi:hypothetical protein